MTLRERQDYVLYEIDDAARRVSEIEADSDELGEEERASLDAARREWDRVKPVLEQMERSFDGVGDSQGEAA